MVRGGRRGEIDNLWDAILCLVLLGLFAWAAFSYIAANATGAQYFSRFYASDISTSAELVNAAYGDVSLRYDNLKQSLDLTFILDNGGVAVVKTPLPAERVNAPEGISTLTGGSPDVASGEPSLLYRPHAIPGEAKRTYGKAPEYPQPGVFPNPRFLALRKSGKSFSITTAEAVLDACPSSPLAVPLKDARVHLDIDGLNLLEGSRASAAFEEALEGTVINIAPDEESATIVLRVARKTGPLNEISFSPTSRDGVRYTCLFDAWLSFLAISEFSTSAPAASEGAFTLGITVTTDTQTQLRAEQIGQALAYALARLYAGESAAAAGASAQGAGS